MFSKLKSLLTSEEADQDLGPDDLQLSCAVLLIEAGHMDGSFDEDEAIVVKKVLKDRFELTDAQLSELFDAANETVKTVNEIYTFTRTVKDRFSHEERIQMIEMLWEVVYADGVLDDYEANLVRRIAGLIYVPDVDAGKARKTVLARLENAH